VDLPVPGLNQRPGHHTIPDPSLELCEQTTENLESEEGMVTCVVSLTRQGLPIYLRFMPHKVDVQIHRNAPHTQYLQVRLTQ
jgi:hypothetical protein